MSKNLSLTKVQRSRTVVLHQEGYSERQISLAEHCSKTAVHNALTKLKNSGCSSDRKRSGRPRNTTDKDDRLIRHIAMQSPQNLSKKMHSALLQKSTNVLTKTVKQGLTKDFGLKAFKFAKKTHLIPTMKLKIMQFAKQHVNWTSDQGLRVLFSDESCIQQSGSRNHSDGRPVGKRFDDKYTQQNMKHSPKIMK